MAVAHAGDVAGPDRDREQHDVAGGEAGDGDAAQQLALGPVVQRAQPVGVERHDAVAELRHRLGQPVAARRARRASAGSAGAW